jgi:hypothetical protein
MLQLLWSIIWGFVVQSKALDHITRRVVDEFGRKSADQPIGSMTIFVEELPSAPPQSSSPINLGDWLITPVPGRFIVVSDAPEELLLLGIVLDSTSRFPPSISWTAISLDAAVSTTLPANALAGIVAAISLDGLHLTPKRVNTYGSLDGCAVLGICN